MDLSRDAYDNYLKTAPEDEFEAGIMQLLYGDVATLESNREQFPGSTSAGGDSKVPVSDPRNGLFDQTHLSNTELSHHHQHLQPQHISYMHNNEDLPTWLGYDPRHDTLPLQQPAPVSPDHHIDPTTTALLPPPAASTPELMTLPPSLEDSHMASASSFYNYFTGLSTAPVASPPRSTVAEPSDIPFSRVFPSIYVNDTSHVFSGGSETAEIAAAAPPPVTPLHRSRVAESSYIPFSRVFPSIYVDDVSHVFLGGSETAEIAAAPPPVSSPPRSTVVEPTEIPFSRVFPSVYVNDISHVFSGGSETAGITTPKGAAEMSATPEQTANMPAGASTSTGKAAPPPVEDRKRKGKVEIVEVEDDTEIRESANLRQATEPPKRKRARTAEMHNFAERNRRYRSNDRLNSLFELTPECWKGGKNKDELIDKSICFLSALKQENGILWDREKYREAVMASQQPYGMMYTPYNYSPPFAMANLPPLPAAGPSIGPTFPVPMYPLAAAGPSMGPTFPVPMYSPAAAGPNMVPTFPVPMYHAPPVPLPAAPQATVTIPWEEYQQMQALRPVRHLAQNREAEQPGGSNGG